MLILTLLDNPLAFAAYILALIIGFTVHEFAHAFAANQLGDDTAKLMRRLTLNPLAHLDPLGTIFLLAFGFGWGKPVEINPNRLKSRTDEIIVSLAGIFANLVLATLFYLPIRLGLIDTNSLASVLLHFIVLINLYLAAFNILPIPPLDGSHVISVFLPIITRNIIASLGTYLLLFILIFSSFGGGASLLSTIMNPIVSFFSLLTTGNSSFAF
ncbi:MAG: site-2 protease family protein [Candidatus Berkelbacteria bacterium]